MAGELVKVTEPVAGRALIAADAIHQEEDQRNLLGRYIQTQMQEGTDYGVIPGTKNRTLLKPGAEKLTQLFRCVPRYTIEEKIEDWSTGLFFYRFRCEIVTQADRLTVAEGVGSCSTYESRYRWRNADRTCPACGKAAIIKGKAEYGGGYLCFKKKDGCGAKFADNDPAITDQPTGRVQNPDLCDQANTVLKMAKKRALVDASISLARCSDIFTQDAEDMHYPEPPRAGADHVPDAEVVNHRPAPATNGHATGNGTPKPSLPADGKELCQRLQDFDAKLAAQKVCPRGALLAHVTQAGVKAGYSPNLTEWAGAAIKFAVDAVKEFDAAARAPKAPPATGAAWAKKFEQDAATALSMADVDELNDRLNEAGDLLTDAEYKACADAVQAAYDRAGKVQAGK